MKDDGKLYTMTNLTRKDLESIVHSQKSWGFLKIVAPWGFLCLVLVVVIEYTLPTYVSAPVTLLVLFLFTYFFVGWVRSRVKIAVDKVIGSGLVTRIR